MNSPVHVEVAQKRQSGANKEHIREIVHSHLCNYTTLIPGTIISNDKLEESPELSEHVHCITLCDAEHETELPMAQVELIYHVYKLDTFGSETDTIADATTGEEMNVADLRALPSEELHGLWESLVFDSRIKEELLRYVETAFTFGERGVNSNVIAWNRVVLLHGPPGTGKTSLCRALAHKLAIRLTERYPRARLLEIDAHSLFSKWFSESGKLVSRLFARVREVAEDARLLTIVLIDEVESLAAARRAALAGLEPSDALRAVNALLTQLDRLRRYPNVLVLTTSNLTGAVDIAFVDRADIKRRVGLPSARAAYQVLRGCCEELMTRALIAPRECLFSQHVLEQARFVESEGMLASLRLWAGAGAAAAARLSGRALRRLPFMACALRGAPGTSLTLLQFIDALHVALQRHAEDEAELQADNEPPPATTCHLTNGHVDRL